MALIKVNECPECMTSFECSIAHLRFPVVAYFYGKWPSVPADPLLDNPLIIDFIFPKHSNHILTK